MLFVAFDPHEVPKLMFHYDFFPHRYYTWGPSSVNTDIEFVPQLWGEKDLSQFTSTINSTLGAGGVKAVLGMNE
jgi:hypothetical protein